jgi:hypothetical protein
MKPLINSSGLVEISIGRLHEGQKRAYGALLGHRFMALRSGRRFGKTDLAKSWIKQGLVQGEACAWFAPCCWRRSLRELRRCWTGRRIQSLPNTRSTLWRSQHNRTRRLAFSEHPVEAIQGRY